MVMSYFQKTRKRRKVESFYMTGKQKKIDASSVYGFCGLCNTVFEGMGCYYPCCPCDEAPPPFTDEKEQRGFKEWKVDDLRKPFIEGKGYNINEIY